MDKFDKVAKTPLDEWISSLKDGSIPLTATTPGLQEARDRLRIDNLSPEDRLRYKLRMDGLSFEASVIWTGRYESMERGLKEGMEKDRHEENVILAAKLKAKGFPVDDIADMTGLAPEEIVRL